MLCIFVAEMTAPFHAAFTAETGETLDISASETATAGSGSLLRTGSGATMTGVRLTIPEIASGSLMPTESGALSPAEVSSETGSSAASAVGAQENDAVSTDEIRAMRVGNEIPAGSPFPLLIASMRGTAPVDMQRLEDELRVSVADGSGASVPVVMHMTRRGDAVTLRLDPRDGILRPGVMRVQVEHFSSGFLPRGIQEFLGGGTMLFDGDVRAGDIAWNADKPVYAAGDEGTLTVSTLNDENRAACMPLNASMTDPFGESRILERTGKDCARVSAQTQFGALFPAEGKYTAAVSWKETDAAALELEATSAPDTVSIRRDIPTQVLPGKTFDAHITLQVPYTFQGQVTERIPKNFAIAKNDSTASVHDEGDMWVITWEKLWEAGKTYTLGYSLTAPDAQPLMLQVGPLRLRGERTETPAQTLTEDKEPLPGIPDENPATSLPAAETGATLAVPQTESGATEQGARGTGSGSASTDAPETGSGFVGMMGTPLRLIASLFASVTDAENRTVNVSEGRPWLILTALTRERARTTGNASATVELKPVQNEFSGTESPTFHLLDTEFGGHEPALTPEGHLPEATALTEIAKALVTDEDVQGAVAKSLIVSASADVGEKLSSDSARRSDLKKTLETETGRTRGDAVSQSVSAVIRGNDSVQEKLADIALQDESVASAIEDAITPEVREQVITAAVTASLQDSSVSDAVSSALKAAKTDLSDVKESAVEAVTQTPEAAGDAVDAIVSREVDASAPLIEVTMTDAHGRVVTPHFHFQRGSVLLVLEPEQRFTPGVYSLTVRLRNPLDGSVEELTQDFAWGVLAMNPTQDRYAVGDHARVDIGVLNDYGEIACDADVELTVMSPGGTSTRLSTDDQSLTVSDDCGKKEARYIQPDYQALFTLAEAGTYLLHLEATTANGTRSLDTHITAGDEGPFTVRRTAATRLWPFAPSPMTISVDFHRDYTGDVTDLVPPGFVVSNTVPAAVTAPAATGTGTTVTWTGSWKAGSTATFSYDYDAPNISPQFYLVGPMRMGDSEELRSWQIANDAAKTWDGGGANNNCSTAANWSGDTIPTSADDIILDSTSTKAMTWDSGCPSTVASWTQSSGYTNTVTVSISNLTVSGTMSIADGTFTAPSGTLTVKGSFTQTAGTFSHNNGTVLLAPTGVQSLTLSAASAFNNLTLDSGLMQYWKLDDLTGSVARDSSRTRANATLINGPTWSGSSLNTLLKYYNPGGLKILASPTQYISATHASEAVNTVSLWVKTTTTVNTTSGCQYLVQFSGGQYIGLGNCSTSTNNESIGIYTDSVSHFSYLGNTISPGWHYLVCRYSAGAWGFYIDGTWYGGLQGVGSFGTHASALTAVTSESVGYNITGALDDVRIYNRSLAFSEMNRLYAGNKATGSGTYVLNNNLTVNGNLGIYDGTLDASSNYDVTVKGNADIQGDFIKGNGSFVMSGTGPQTLSGSTLFNNFSITASSARTAYLDYTSRQSVSGSLVLQGVSGNNLSLRSTKRGSGARILYDADSTQLDADIQYVNVKDSYANGGQSPVCSQSTEGCVDSGNTQNWVIQTSNISGTVYTDQGTTAATSPTVGLSINGAPFITTTANSSGQFTFSNVSMTGGTVLGFFVSGNALKAATVMIGPGTTTTGVDLYGNTLIIRSDPGTIPVTNPLLKIAANGGGSDMAAVYSVDSANTLSLASGKSVYLWANTTLNPGGRISASSLTNLGTLTMGTSGLTLTGSLLTSAGTFSTSTGTLLKSRATSQPLTLGSNSLNKLTINNGLVGYWKLDDGTGLVARDSSPTQSNGTLTNNPSWSGANLATQMRFYNPSAMKFDGTDDYISIPDNAALHPTSLTVSLWVKLSSLTNNATCGGAPSTQQYLIFKKNSQAYDSFSLIKNSGVWQFSMYSGSTSYYIQSSTVPVTGSWVHLVGTYANSTMKFYVNGSLEGTTTNAAGLDHSTNNLILGRTARCTTGDNYDAPLNGFLDDVRIYNRALSANEVSSLYNGNKNTGSGKYVLSSNTTIAGDLNVYAGALDAAGYNVSVSGNANLQADLTLGGGTMTLNGSGPQTISGSTVFSNLTKTVSAASTLYLDYTSRQSVSGALVLRGAAANLLSIRSTKSGSGARILLDGDAGTQTIDYLNVKDSNASGGQTLACDVVSEGCIGGTNNTNWQIYTNTLSGTVYTDQGVTAANSPTVRLAINGSLFATTTADSGGHYSFSNVSMTGGSVLTLYTTGSVPAVTAVAGVQSVMTDLDLYGNTLIVRSEDSGMPITNAMLLSGMSVGVNDIASICTVTANNDLIVNPGKTLYVWSGKYYTPGGNVIAGSLKNLGTMAMGTYALRIANSLTTNAGTLTTSTGVVLRPFTSAGTLTLGSNTLNKVIMGYDMATGNAGPVGSWNFNEASGTTCYDGSGNGNNATLVNSPTRSVNVAPVFYGNSGSLLFSSSAQYANVTSASALNPGTSNFTLSIWIKPTSIPASSSYTIISKYNYSGGVVPDKGYILSLNSAGKIVGYIDSDNPDIVSTSTVSTSQWTHVVLTYNNASATAKIFLNGVLDKTQTGLTSRNATSTRDLTFGYSALTGLNFAGTFDEIRLYNRELSNAEITLMAAGYNQPVNGTYTLGSALTASSNVTIGSGSTLDASSGNYNLSVGGDWLNKGGFTKRSGTVTFNGNGTQTLSGSTAFHNLTVSASTARTVNFAAGTRQTVSGSLTLNGATSNRLSLRSTVTSTQASLLLDGDSGTQSISELDVKDSNASGGQALVCNSCSNTGNNTNWIFPITGKVYSDAGSQAVGAGHTVAVSVNGGTPTTATTDSSGNFSLSKVISAGDVVAVYLTGTTNEDGAIVTVSDGNASAYTYNIYQDHLIVRNENGGSLTNANLATAASVGDTQLAELFGVSGGALTMGTDKTLLVPSGHTFAPGGTVNAANVTVQGTFTMGTNAVNVARSWNSTSGTFTGTNTVTFTGSGTIRKGSSNFSTLVFNALNGKWTPVSSLATTGNLTVTAGMLNLSGSSLTVGGTFRNDDTLRMHGDETLTTVTNDTAHGGTVWYDGKNSYTGLNGFTSFANLTLSGAGVWTLSSNIAATGNVTLTTGTLLQKQKTISVGGNWTDTATFTSSGSMVFTGNGNITEPRGFKSLTVNAAGGTVALQQALTVSGSIVISAGTLDVSAANHKLTLSGSLTNNGSFNARAGTVVLNGGNQSIAGSSNTTFYNLTKTVTSAATLTLPTGATTTTLGATVLQGAPGQLLSLRSSTPGTKAPFTIGATGRSISYVDVKDQNNAGSTVVCDTVCSNSLNNTGWSFPVSVNVYTDAGVTPAADGTTVAFGLNGVLQTTADTVSGAARFTSVEVLPGDILTFWISGESITGATVVVSDAQQLSIPLYKNTLILRSEGASSITNANIATATVSDADLSAVYGVSGGALTMAAGNELRIPSGNTYAPGGTVNARDLTVEGTFTMGTNAVNVARSWNSTSGTFTGTNTVTFTGSGTIRKGSSNFSTLVFNALNGKWTPVSSLATTGNLTVTAGMLNLSGSSLTVGGTFRNDDTLRMHGDETLTTVTNDTAHGGTVWYDGKNSYTGLNGFTSFANLTLSGAGVWTLNNAITVGGNHTLTKGTLNQNGQSITVGGDWTDTATFIGNGTTTFTNTASITEPGHFGSLTVNAPSKTVTLSAPLNVSGSLILRNGTLDVGSNKTISLDGVWEKESGGSFTQGAGTVRLTGVNQTLSGSTTFYNLSKRTSVPATLTFNAGTTQTVQGTWTMRGAAGNLLALQSSTAGQQWNINPSAYDLQYFSVQDSNNTSGTTILAANDATSAGNNTDWAFPMVVHTLAQDGTPLGSGITVSAFVDTNPVVTSTTNGSGIATFNDGTPSHLVNGLNDGARLTLYFHTGSSTGTLITVTNGTTLDFDVYADTLSVGSQGTNPVTNATIQAASGALHTAGLSLLYSKSGSALRMGTGVTLRAFNGTYSPGSRVYASTVRVAGTLEMDTNDVYVSQDWDATGGSFSGNNTTYFTATSDAYITSNNNETVHDNYFHNVTFIVSDGSASHWTTTDLFQFTGVQTVVNPYGSTDLFPPIISNLSVSNITSTTARVLWRTAEASTEAVRYGTVSGSLGLTESGIAGDYNMTHVITLTGLSPGTTYYYKAVSTDSGNNEGTSAEQSFTTAPADTAAPVITHTATGSLTSTSVRVIWDTNETATGAVLYGTNSLNLNLSARDTGYNMHHDVSIESLTPDTVYYFKVYSTDASGNQGNGTLLSFRTLPVDTTPPVISDPATESLASTSVRVTWTTNESATGAVLYGTDSGDLSQVQRGTGYNMSHSILLSGLTPGTVYYWKAAASDATGNETIGDLQSFTTPALDTTPPVISDTATGSLTSTGVQVSWNTDETATGAVLYGTDSGDLSNRAALTTFDMHHAVSLSGLEPGTAYYFKVQSTDTSGNSSEDSVKSFTTISVDTTPPVISDTATGSLTTTSVTVRWRTNEITTELVNYGTASDNLEFSASTGTNNMRHFVDLEGLSPGTTYYFEPVSTDTAGNTTHGDVLSFTTPSPDTTGPVVSDLSAALLTDSEAVVTWNTDEAAQMRIDYGTDSGALVNSASNDSFNVSHYTVLSSLSAEVPYYYQITTVDAEGNSTVESIHSFNTIGRLYTQSQVDEEVAAAVASVTAGGGSIFRWRDLQPPKLSGFTVDAQETSAVIGWTTDEPSTSLVESGRDSAHERGTFDTSSLTGSLVHAVTLTHLSPATTYKYVAISYDAAGNAGIAEEQSFTTLGTPPGSSSSSQASSLSSEASSASTSSSSSSLHPAAPEENTVSAFDQAIAKAVSIAESLGDALSGDQYRATLQGGVFALQKLARTTLAPVYSSEPKVEFLPDAVKITWTTDVQGSSLVSYAPEKSYAKDAYLQTSGQPQDDVNEHAVLLFGLTPGTRYHYQARTVTAVGTESVSPDLTFTTPQSAVEILTYKTEILGPDSARFTWTTSAPTTSAATAIPYLDGIRAPEQAITEQTAGFGTEHSITLNGFDSTTYYEVELWGTTSADLTVSKVISRFVTAKDGIPLEITGIQTNSALLPGKDSRVQAVITWVTNISASSRVSFQKGIAANPDEPLQQVAQEPAGYGRKHVVVLPSLEPGSIYSFRVESTDTTGHSVVSRTYTMLTPREKESVFHVIINQIESIFGWVNQLRT